MVSRRGGVWRECWRLKAPVHCQGRAIVQSVTDDDLTGTPVAEESKVRLLQRLNPEH